MNVLKQVFRLISAFFFVGLVCADKVPEFHFRIDWTTPYRLELPQKILDSIAYEDLRWFEDKENPRGIEVDLNNDNTKDYIVRGRNRTAEQAAAHLPSLMVEPLKLSAESVECPLLWPKQ